MIFANQKSFFVFMELLFHSPFLGSGFRVVVAASPQIYIGRCPKVVCKSLATHPCFQTFWGILFLYRHPERSRGIFLALRSVSHRHWQGNDVLVHRISAFTHASFIGLQGRFLGNAFNDDTRRYERLLVTSHQSLATSHKLPVPVIFPPSSSVSVRGVSSQLLRRR